MRSAPTLRAKSLYLYTPGDILSEPDRLLYNTLQPLTLPSGATPTGATPSSIWDLIKPGEDDLKGVKSALKFLKFSADDITNYFNAIGSLVNVASGIVSIVGIVSSAKEILTQLGVLESAEAKVQKALQEIGVRLEQIYSYLARENRKGLFVEARTWRQDIEKARGAVSNANVSRSPINLNSLTERAADLDGSLTSMLDTGSGDIAFQRSVYGYKPWSGHWIDSAASPWLSLANGGQIQNYANEASELASSIWDPGHYVDVLVRALSDRLLLVATAEPLFRSTAYDRTQLGDLVTGLTKFIEKWKASMIVVDPTVGINPGGHVRNPIWTQSAPPGILLGAIDPVTGTAAWSIAWEGFAKKFTTNKTISLTPSSHPDYAEAIDPAQAIKDARDAQWSMLDFVIGVSGIPHLVQLRMHLQTAASVIIGSEVVKLPNARFDLLGSPWTATQPVMVDLGRLKKYASDPNKTYAATRNYQEIEKTFRFSMAKRTDVSLIQLGYRLTIGKKSIPLIDFNKIRDMTQGVTFPSTRAAH
jgi:hypothetical protein